jgi:hypothetical protein
MNVAVHHRPRQSGQSIVFNLAGITRLLWEILGLIARFKLRFSGNHPGKAKRFESNEGKQK